MRAGEYSIVLLLALIATLLGCSRDSPDPIHRVNDKLVASTSQLGDEIQKAIASHVEAGHDLGTCEKHAKNALVQCAELKVTLARAAARLCGLQTQRAMLHKIMENSGDARGVNAMLGESCDLG